MLQASYEIRTAENHNNAAAKPQTHTLRPISRFRDPSPREPSARARAEKVIAPHVRARARAAVVAHTSDHFFLAST